MQHLRQQDLFSPRHIDSRELMLNAILPAKQRVFFTIFNIKRSRAYKFVTVNEKNSHYKIKYLIIFAPSSFVIRSIGDFCSHYGFESMKP
jgi:hypothetical protein